MNIDDLDFKHLVLLEALLRKQSVTGAARSLDMPQPTASHGLARLRAALDDPLLVRVGGGMRPTERALSLLPTVGEILRLRDGLGAARDDFDPADLRREFTIAGSDIGQLIVLTALERATREAAPKVTFRGVTLAKEEMTGALERGEVDLAFGAYPRLVAGVFQQTLYDEQYRCFVAPDHPFAARPTEARYRAADHILISTRGLAHAHREVEKQLSRAIDAQRIRLVTNSFLVAALAATTTDLVVTAPGRFLADLAERLGLVVRHPPLSLEGFSVRQYWHGRNKDDAAHQWLRKTMNDALGPSKT